MNVYTLTVQNQTLMNGERCARPGRIVALVGKYTQLHDAYISVVEALKHGGVYNSCDVTIKWIDSETVTPETADELLSDVSGILVPGGFGDRGTEGKIEAIQRT